MTDLTKGPMLAGNAPSDLDKLHYPVLTSAKLDGIRCLIVSLDWFAANIAYSTKYDQYVNRANEAIAISRTLKPIPNWTIQKALDNSKLVGLDGELLVGKYSEPGVYNRTQSGVMSRKGDPDFSFSVFDDWQLAEETFTTRMKEVGQRKDLPEFVKLHPQWKVADSYQFLDAEASYLRDGYEGTIIRDPSALYKFGRSTTKQGWMLKRKPLTDGEAIITGVEQGTVNLNKAELDERGYTKRSSHKTNKVPDNIVGALVGRMLDPTTKQLTTQPVRVGIFKNWTKPELRMLWENRAALLGRIMKIQYFAYGVKDMPRHARFLGFRSLEDL